MLRSLSIKNFAIIDDLTLEFSPGFNVLTGETGAGKSILIEALGFLLGARANPEWLRAGASKLEVTGTFDSSDFPGAIRTQFKLGSGPVNVRRELDAGGKTRAFIQSQPVPLSVLAAWGEGLVDFHGQHEHQRLLKPSAQRECLDRFGDYAELLNQTASAHSRWQGLRAEKDGLTLSDEERLRRIDMNRFQLQEIVAADPRPGEEEALEAELPGLKNADRLSGMASAAYEVLYEAEGSVSAGLMNVSRSLAEMAKLDAELGEAHSAAEAARISLEEVAGTLSRVRERSAAGPERLDEILTRLDALSRLKKKYGATVGEILAFRDRLQAELSALENHEGRARDLEKELSSAEADLAGACERIHRARLKAARRLESAAQKELKTLGMPLARFSIAVEMEEGQFARAGSDTVEFLLAANPGESAKPVRAIASGGELSRVMLALKTVLAQADTAGILVFDEVDAGIGGAVAREVGEKLALAARSHQILCVTHLAQVACFGGRHLHAAKEVARGRTCVRVTALEGTRRLETLATLLGGRQATPASRRHAQELLESSAA